MRSALHPPSSASMPINTPVSTRKRAMIMRHLNQDMGLAGMALDIVIMAAGKGTRMKSDLPKVLHKLAGRSLLQHVLQSAAGLGADGIVVITGHGADRVEASVHAPNLRFARQMPQLGTGHAVLQAAPLLHESGTTLILNGDVPLIEAATA